MPSGGTSGGVAPSEEKKSTSGLAVASMVCGILSIVGCCIWYMGIILAIVGLVLGIISQAKQKNGFSLAGIITSAFGLAFGIIALIIVIASFAIYGIL